MHLPQTPAEARLAAANACHEANALTLVRIRKAELLARHQARLAGLVESTGFPAFSFRQQSLTIQRAALALQKAEHAERAAVQDLKAALDWVEDLEEARRIGQARRDELDRLGES